MSIKCKPIKIKKDARFEPYEECEVINVPPDRHKLTSEQIRTANEYFKYRKLCSICGSKFDEDNLAQIDHCHVTGVIRGKLCYRCNVGLGYFKENWDIVQRAADYLNYFKYRTDLVEPSVWDEENISQDQR